MSKILCTVGGGACITVGLWMIYPPAALIVFGVALIANAIGLDRMEGDSK